jgi:hypothetical protein
VFCCLIELFAVCIVIITVIIITIIINNQSSNGYSPSESCLAGSQIMLDSWHLAERKQSGANLCWQRL